MSALSTLAAHFAVNGSIAVRQAANCSGVSLYTSCPGSAASLACPANSKSAHGLATFSAHSGVQ